jgi:hypothetical protein
VKRETYKIGNIGVEIIRPQQPKLRLDNLCNRVKGTLDRVNNVS